MKIIEKYTEKWALSFRQFAFNNFLYFSVGVFPSRVFQFLT